MLATLDWHKSCWSSVRTAVIAHQLALWPSLFEQSQYVGLPVSIWWAPVVCLCSWSVPCFKHSHWQYLKLSCETETLEIYRLSSVSMSCTLWTSYLTCLQKCCLISFYKSFHKPIDWWRRELTPNYFFIVFLIDGIWFIGYILWFSQQSMTISADHYLHTQQKPELSDLCAGVCIGEHWGSNSLLCLVYSMWRFSSIQITLRNFATLLRFFIRSSYSHISGIIHYLHNKDLLVQARNTS